MNFDVRRRRLFDQAAVDYDLYRPSYPGEAIRHVAVRSGLSERSKILEIGCGTGKATVLFARQGFRMDCVEPGVQLARIAEANCAPWPEVHVHITEFEEFHFEPKSYDLLFSAQAFHWVDPSTRMRRASSALREGGYLALIYNYTPEPNDRALLDLSKLLAAESGGRLDDPWDRASDIRLWEEEIAGSRRFDHLHVSHFPWERTLTAAQYVGQFHTYSDFLRLPNETKARLVTAMTDFIGKIGGALRVSYDCVVFHCRCAVDSSWQ